MIDHLVLGLYDLGAVQFGSFRLKSGAFSPVYLDLRLLVADPVLLARVAEAYVLILKDLSFDRLAAVPYAGLPIATAVALAMQRPLIYPRREVKEYGTQRAIEGRYQAGETAVLLDDVISNGASKLEAVRPLAEAGLVVRDVVVLIDRQGTGREELAAAGIQLHAVLTLTNLVERLVTAGRISRREAQAVEEYIASGASAARPS